MNGKKLAKAGAKLAGAASCAVGAAGAFVVAGLVKLPGTAGFLYAAGAGMGASALTFGSQAISDTVAAFRDEPEDDQV